MAIYFYSTKDPYGAFSNFSRYEFELDGLNWPTSEHYFQAQKFEDPDYREKIRAAPSPKIAARLGRSHKVPLRPDWEEIKDAIMRKAVLAKIHAHPELKQLLLSTGQEEIIENSAKDYYWGCGANGSGRNRLGKILMEIRDELRDGYRRPDP
jgi:ribA/ribD-fused uncharacterized protein